MTTVMSATAATRKRRHLEDANAIAVNNKQSQQQTNGFHHDEDGSLKIAKLSSSSSSPSVNGSSSSKTTDEEESHQNGGTTSHHEPSWLSDTPFKGFATAAIHVGMKPERWSMNQVRTFSFESFDVP